MSSPDQVALPERPKKLGAKKTRQKNAASSKEN
jgi:hypothetical protein